MIGFPSVPVGRTLLLLVVNICSGYLLRANKVGQDYFTSVQSLTSLVYVENTLLNFLEKHQDVLDGIDPE